MSEATQPTIVFSNGQWQEQHSYLPTQANFNVMPLQQAKHVYQNLLGSYLNEVNPEEQGLFIYFNKNIYSEQPLHLIFQQQDLDQIKTHYRNIIYLDSESSTNIVAYYLSDARPNEVNSINQVILQPNASLTWYHVQQFGEATDHNHTINIDQNAHSKFYYHQFDFGGHKLYHDIQCQLLAEHAHCELNGLYILDGSQYLDNNSVINHQKPSCYSREYFKGILDGNSRGIFRGRTQVYPHAIHTDAKQYNRNLLLSPRAEVDSFPCLEIYADDVQCAHGATVSQLDEDELFYLRSRGIDAKKAASLLCYGFAQELIKRVELEDVSRLLDSLLAKKRGEYA